MPKTTGTINPAKRATLLYEVELGAQEHRRTLALRDIVIANAVECGVTQTDVAKAAGMSQAHVSRVVSAARKAAEARKATRRPRTRRESRTV